MKNKFKFSKIIEYGLYLLIFLLPWQARMIYKTGELAGGFWEYGTYSIYVTELLLLVLVLMNIVQVVRKQTKKQETRNKKQRTTTVTKLLNYFIVLFFIVNILTVFWAQDSGLALFKFVTLLEGFMFFWLIVSSEVKFRKLAWAIVLSGLAQAGLGIWQFLSQEIVGNKWLGMATQFPMDGGVSVVETALRRWLRAYGSLPHPNMLGGFLTIGLVLCIGLYDFLYRELWGSTRNKKLEKRKRDGFLILKIVILLCCYIVMLFGLLASFSRGAWIAFVIVFLFFCFFVFLKKDKVRRTICCKLLIISVIMVALFGVTFSEPFLARVSREGRLEMKSVEQRIDGYKEAGDVLKDNWLKGVGVGNYTLYLYKNIPKLKRTSVPPEFESMLSEANKTTEKKVWDYQPVHNLYLLVWAELGVFGLLFFVSILLFIIYYLLFIKWALISFITLIAVIILSSFDHYFWSLYFGVMMWWMILGLTLILRYDNME